MADPNDENKPDSAPTAAADPDAKQAAPEQAAGENEKLNTENIEKLLDQASDSLDEAVGGKVSADANPQPFALGDLTQDDAPHERQPIDLLGEVEMDLRVELGRTQMRLEEVLQLRSGSVVALDKLAGDPVDIFVNGRLIARGEVLVMNDNFCIRVTELVGA
ncbi:Flagellar motor switch protein FliN [Rubripirellula lacrimiformis]|uniref:Flagellar motor switch protein FliN n=1 Tax=Rubripirellula lacrimiformis TaxID=1930273 RepID=A0A517N6N2_9BACT|nr:flagellar motor switch protein FliN [Rubripirellula lacrimiformis]QDT02668.1 Flagellar motor switch protein FliN [Rubripirellula lacrimiformis]